jgi:enoyl-CoA hydratase/carnithine racemase
VSKRVPDEILKKRGAKAARAAFAEVSAVEAYRLGLVSQIVSAAELLPTVEAFARMMGNLKQMFYSELNFVGLYPYLGNKVVEKIPQKSFRVLALITVCITGFVSIYSDLLH